MDAPWFGMLMLLAVAGAAYDVLLGKTLRWRKWLQAGIVALVLLAVISVPSCGTDEGRPDGPDIPYRF